jgi:shikimate kinase
MTTQIEIADSTILYGMMGSGKSTQGRMLAETLEQPFLDTDAVLEAETGRSCKQLIDAGQFATVQEVILTGLQIESPTVIATGGSVANFPKITDHLGRFGVGMFLRVMPTVLRARLSDERIAALHNPDGLPFEELYMKRMPNYERVADIVVDIGDQDPEITAAQVLRARVKYEFRRQKNSANHSNR